MTIDDTDLPVAQRLTDVLDHLGVERAHFAASGFTSRETNELLRAQPSAFASLTYIATPPQLDAEAVRPLADRLAVIAGSTMTAMQRRSQDEIDGWNGPMLVELPPDYPAQLWSDIVHDNADLIVGAMRKLASNLADAPAVAVVDREGVVSGVRYRVTGSGPPLVLFPIGLAPTQWDAAIPELSKTFTTIRLGGSHIGMVNGLERRAAMGTYLQGVRSLFDLMEVGPGQRVLEVGIGSGALVRDLAKRPNAPAEIVAVDINEYLLDEAQALAEADGSVTPIEFKYGNAEELPFEDESFDVAYSVTVFEECDVERGIAELHRVLRPGGRAGVIIRSDDLPQHWSIDGSDELRARINVPMPEEVTGRGCVDASLYGRFARHFIDVRPNPVWNSVPVGELLAETWASRLRAVLDPAEVEAFDRALERGRASGVGFASKPLHSVVGTKPPR